MNFKTIVNNIEYGGINLNDLLQPVKEKLSITWNEQDDFILGLIATAIDDINTRSGFEFDYTSHGLHRVLMFEHVFYNRENQLNEFYRAYSPELMELSLRVAQEALALDGGGNAGP